jgi:hypothetical protein
MAKIIERIERIIEGNFLKVYNNTVNAAHDYKFLLSLQDCLIAQEPACGG